MHILRGSSKVHVSVTSQTPFVGHVNDFLCLLFSQPNHQHSIQLGCEGSHEKGL